jgi:hypothetical protein
MLSDCSAFATKRGMRGEEADGELDVRRGVPPRINRGEVGVMLADAR